MLGACDYVPAITPVNVYPVITYGGRLESKSAADAAGRLAKTMQREEVEQVFFASVEELREGRGSRRLTTRNGTKMPIEGPTFDVPGCDVQVWGLTGFLLDGVLRVFEEEAMKLEETRKTT